MRHKQTIGRLKIGTIYMRANDRHMWIKVDELQHATAIYNSTLEQWEMGSLVDRPFVVEDFDPHEQVEPR